jgi:hypothetical protein
MNRKHKIILFAAAALLLAALAVIFFPKKNSSSPHQSAEVSAATTPLLAPSLTPSAEPSPLAITQSLPPAITPPFIAPQVSKRRTIPLRFEEFDQRILLAPKEIVTLQIDAGVADSGDSIKIDAPNGGSINGRKAPAVVRAADAGRGVQFAVGPSRGLYTLEVSRGRETRIFEFWVDRESPVGQPGPERTFVH